MLCAEFTQPLGLPAKALATALDVPKPTLQASFTTRKPQTPELAAKLAVRFVTTPEFWLNLQSAYDSSFAGE